MFAPGSFERLHDIGARIAACARIATVYPYHIPIIVESQDFVLSRSKFLAPNDITITQFVHALRGPMCIRRDQPMFLLVDNGTVMLSSTILLRTVASHNKSKEDGFLYIILMRDNAFGLC
jgi:hypothetical protein